MAFPVDSDTVKRMFAKKPQKKPLQPRNLGFVLGRDRFERISEIEGVVTSQTSRLMFAEFDRLGLTPEQRRKAILEKHTRSV